MNRQLIEWFCLREDLSTGDPYDIWKTGLGFKVKNYYNCHKKTGLLAAAPLTLFDTFINNRTRFFYRRQEYPIVRALAALALLNLYERNSRQVYLDFANRHLGWLAGNSSKGYSGHCWGLHFKHAAGCGLVYDSNMPFSTITPYPLEAFIRYHELTGDNQYNDIVKSIFYFFENDIQVMEQTDSYLVTSYAPVRDRIVINAVAYTMFSYSLLLPCISDDKREYVREKINRLYAFIRNQQRDDGSWLYSPEGKSFIDCFHTCIVIKNLHKVNRIVGLSGGDEIVRDGYNYLKQSFFDRGEGLFRRFSVSNKPSIVRFDLYDNAEALNLAVLLGDRDHADRLESAMRGHFCSDLDIYSQIDVLGSRRNRNMLRWAVMPYLYALSQLESDGGLH